MTPYANFIQEYYHKMTTGEIVVGKWVRILYEKITAGLRDGLFYFDERKPIARSRLSRRSAITARDVTI